MEYTSRYGIAKHGPYGEKESLSAYSVVNVAMDRIDELFWEFQLKIDEIWDRIGVIEDRLEGCEENITNLWKAVQEIINKIGGDVDTGTGDVTWDIDGTVAVGNINVYSSSSGYLRTTSNTLSSPGTNDIRVQ